MAQRSRRIRRQGNASIARCGDQLVQSELIVLTGGFELARLDPWFNAKLKEAANVYEYKTLVKHGTVSTPRGETACFSPEHAMDHLTKSNVGDWRSPNLTMRQPFNAPGRPAAATTMRQRPP